MKRYTDIIHFLTNSGMIIGAIFLVLMMVIVVANVVVRLFGGIIAGSYEMVEMMIVVPVAFALGYTVSNKGSIVVDFVIVHLKPSVRLRLDTINSALGFITWGIIAYAGYRIMAERMTNERTEMLEIPVLPFRLIWLAGMILLCLIYALDFINSLRQVKK
jgi:TRAP-type C4-dicarboxylate transport system permease small subunit